jgi:hypothetical protein
MPFCVNCGESLKCKCEKPEQPIGQTVINCPKLAKGKLWIHVTDDLGVNVRDVPVSGKTDQPTDGAGLAKWEELDPGAYTAAMNPSPANLKTYDISKKTELSKSVPIKAGVLAYVQFVLIRKAKLKVRFVVKSGANLATQSPLDAVVPVKATYTGEGAQPGEDDRRSASGTADFEVVSAGKYVLSPTFTGLSKDDYEYVEDPRAVALEPGDDREVVFEVARKATLTAKFLLKACGPKFPDRLPFKTTAILVEAVRKAKGSKDSKPTVDGEAMLKLTPAAYTVTPGFSVLDDTLFEWKAESRDVDVAGDDDAVFEIGRKATLKVVIVYKHDRDCRLRDKEDGVVPIKLEFLGNDFKPAATLPDVSTKDGIADFRSLSPGKYKITPDFTKLESSKFDHTPETREVEVFPGGDDVIFEVEPLYQKVQFIGHTLLTIPTQVFEPAPQDADKLEITTAPNGKRTFKYKSRVIPGEPYDKFYFTSALNDGPCKNRAYFSTKGNATTLVLKKKTPASLGSWTLADLDPLLSDTSKVEFGPGMVANFKMKSSVTEEFMASDLKGVWKARYHGCLKDPDDIAKRIAFVADTLEKAYAQAKRDPTVLKVFMLPECFFQGLYGAYLVDDASALLTKLQELVAEPKWKDWVFSFGTINSVFAALPPKDVTYTRPIYEMRNHAPVIRGGLGAGKAGKGHGDTSTRMIQKLVNSAELADDLIVNPNATRLQAINADVQFSDTENDNKVGKLLMQVLNDERATGAPGTHFTGQGLPPGWLANLIESLHAILGIWGLPRVTRAIRVADNSAVNAKPLAEWMYVASDGSVNNKSVSVLEKDAVLIVIEQQWKTQFTDSLVENWQPDDVRRVAVLDAIISNVNTPADACGFVLRHQKDAILSKIRELKANDPAAKMAVPDAMPRRKWKPVIFPIWKKLVELYKAHVGNTAPIELSKESLNLDDYCFAGPRKVGPWFGALNDARGKEACKIMVFGLEICADHAANRLQAINTGGNAVGIDIQLVPSAGMRPGYFAARQGGYIFNCDGWNKKPPKGGKAITVPFDGPNPYTTKNEDNYDVDVCPVFPHTAVAKRTGAATTIDDCLEPKSHPVNAALTDVIFESGEGELHVYEVQDLPK